jgi:predicted transposase YbfD/YdcC
MSSTNHLVLGQIKVDEKSNDITVIPELLKLIDIRIVDINNET